MTKKIIVIFTALLLTASFCACSGGKGNGETSATSSDTVNIESSTTSESATDEETGTGSTNQDATAANPGEYSYTECNDTVYVKSPVTLRTADYEAKGSVAEDTELKRVGISKSDDKFDGYWSKVIYEEETYYVASKYVTTMKNPDEGFVEVSKTVRLSEGTQYLNIRDLPDMSGTYLGEVKNGQDIKVVAENTTTGWYKIEFVKAGETEKSFGYIASDAKYFASETETTDTEAAQ